MISVDRRPGLDVGANVGLEQVLFAIAYDSGANLATAFKDALTEISSLVPVSVIRRLRLSAY